MGRHERHGPLVVVGDALIDRDLDGRVERVAPDAPAPVVDQPVTTTRPGGAGLAATLAATDRPGVVLVTALAGDAAGRELETMLAAAGVEVIDVGLDGATPEKTRIRAGGRTLVRVDRGGGTVRGDAVALVRAEQALRRAAVVLVADYGNGVASDDRVRSALAGAAARGAALVWDPHPRGLAPVDGTLVATPNRGEAERLVGGAETARGTPDLAARLLRLWTVRNVCVTTGAHGAVLALSDGSLFEIPTAPATGDSCGAGDRFSSRMAVALADGEDLPRAAAAATAAATRYVEGAARRPAGRLPGEDALELARKVRAGGGTVVVAGGCFDLLHAGHVRMLERARGLGDCLIVCINSDDSVRRLKGAGRPVIDEQERAEMLCSLRCVDAVSVFDEDTPADVLRELRPHVFAKGGDYSAAELPEARVLRRWGGRVAILPYVEGRSTTRLIEEAFDASLS
jgi:D-beta-D-heptose 7-phosphate kinase/D-beta-D-heptose 1-phosphate adenosyltransferase